MRYVDRVMETTTTAGLGSLVLGGAVRGFRTFDAALDDGDEVTYALAAGAAWEVGTGVFTAPATLSRVTILASSTGAKVDLAAGTKTVFVTQAAARVIDRTEVQAVIDALPTHGQVLAASLGFARF